MVAFKLLFRARDCWTHAALKLQSEHCNVAKGPNFNFQFVVPCLVLILSELRALSLSPNLNLQFEKACITLRSSSILCEVWILMLPSITLQCPSHLTSHPLILPFHFSAERVSKVPRV